MVRPSRAISASKVARAHLVARLKAGGFRLRDCQFQTDHLASLGASEVERPAYVALLDEALGLGSAAGGATLPVSADFFALDRAGATTETVSGPVSAWRIVQLLGQTS